VRGCGVGAAVAWLVLAAPAGAVAPSRFVFDYHVAKDQIRTVVVRGVVPRSVWRSGVRVRLEVQDKGKFVRALAAAPRRPRFRLRYVVPVSRASTLKLRVQVTRGTRVIASSPTRTIVFGQTSYAKFKVPSSTREYRGSDVARVRPRATPGEAAVDFKSHENVPPAGGHVAIGPAPGLPDGMFAKVVSAKSDRDGRSQAVVQQAPISEVFPGIRYGFDGPITPRLVDASGNPVPHSRARSGGIVIRGLAGPRAADDVFDCKSSGAEKHASELWKTLRPMPLEVMIDNTHVLHSFDAGSAFPRRAPSLLFQFSGDATASIGFEAKTSFSCALSATYRKNHRFQFPIRNIGDVPVVAYLEPTLKFEVSASGQFQFVQKHYFAITLQKQGASPIRFSLARSADHTKPTLTASLDATMFVGGDLALLVGGSAGGFGAGAGLDGDFGPEIGLSTASTKPGCVSATARLKADLSVRLEIWTPAWDRQADLKLGSLTSAKWPLLGSPFCLPGYGATGGDMGNGNQSGSSTTPGSGTNGSGTGSPAPVNVVSVDENGFAGAARSSEPRISHDGRFVWFDSNANLVAAPMSEATAVYVRDLAAGVTERIALLGIAGESDYLNAISPSGRYAYISVWAPGRNATGYVVDRTTQAATAAPYLFDSREQSVGIEDDGDTVIFGYNFSLGLVYHVSTGTLTPLTCPDGSPPNGFTGAARVSLTNSAFAAMASAACTSKSSGYILNLSTMTLTLVASANCSFNLGEVCVDSISVDDDGLRYASSHLMQTAIGVISGQYLNQRLIPGTLDFSSNLCGVAGDGGIVDYVSYAHLYAYHATTDDSTVVATHDGPQDELGGGLGCTMQSVARDGTVVYEDATEDAQAITQGQVLIAHP
jgi:hypothetical protein